MMAVTQGRCAPGWHDRSPWDSIGREATPRFLPAEEWPWPAPACYPGATIALSRGSWPANQRDRHPRDGEQTGGEMRGKVEPQAWNPRQLPIAELRQRFLSNN